MPRLRAIWGCLLVLAAGWAERGVAGEVLIDTGAWAQGAPGWAELGATADKEIAVVACPQGPGGKALRLKRIKAGAAAMAVYYNLKFQPQTLYRLTVTGFGPDKAAITFKPKSSQDDKYQDLCKSWATCCAPVPASEKPATYVFDFDSGLKADQAFMALRLEGEAPGEYCVTAVKLEALRSTKPDGKEIVVGHIGDSITITSYLPYGERVNAVLDRLLTAKFPGKAIRSINVGVDGEFIQELTDTGRYDHAIKGQYPHFDILVIRYGANDRRKYDAKEFAKRLGELCDRLEKDYPGVKIVIGTGTYLKGSDANKQYTDFWQAGRDVAAARKYPLAEICGAFEKANAADLTLGPDNMHPSAKGVEIAAAVELAVMVPLLEKR